jgi:hypothetical protein
MFFNNRFIYSREPKWISAITAFILLLLLLFHYYHHYKTVATDKPLRASLFPSAAELTTHLLRLINILWLPLCWINKYGFYFPRRLLRSPILVGHQDYFLADEGMTPRSLIFAYPVPAKEEALSKDTRSPQGPALRLGVEGKKPCKP